MSNIESIYYVAHDGLKIYPVPMESALTVEFKVYLKRKWWEFWKPKVVLLTKEETNKIYGVNA